MLDIKTKLAQRFDLDEVEDFGSWETDLHVRKVPGLYTYLKEQGFLTEHFHWKGGTWIEVPFALLDDRIREKRRLRRAARDKELRRRAARAD